MINKVISITRTPFVYLWIGLIALTACAHIPSEAPELSAELGNRISAIEKSHIRLLRNFFDEKRNQVDEFILEEWIPTFAEEFFSNPKIEKIWEEIVRSNNKKDRLELLVRLGPKLQSKISAKRVELVKPLDLLERSIERKLRDEYEQAKAINNSITSFLLSASKVAENRNRYLRIVGVTDKKIANAMDEVDSAVSLLLNKAKTTENKKKVAEKYMERLKTALESLKNLKGD